MSGPCAPASLASFVTELEVERALVVNIAVVSVLVVMPLVLLGRTWCRCSAAVVADPRRSPDSLVPDAPQAASLYGWSGAGPAYGPQRLRRPSSPALRRIPREPRSSAAAALR